MLCERCKRKVVITLPLNDPQQWPLRMTKAEVAHVCRRSTDTIERRVNAGLMPPPDDDGFFIRDEIERYLRGGVRDFDKRRRRFAYR